MREIQQHVHANPMKWLLLSMLLAAGWSPRPVHGDQARCVIRQNGITAYAGACDATIARDGSFSIRRHAIRRQEPSGTLLSGISLISVSMVSAGVAEVRGLTSDGILSRWGSARRSQRDPACWTGADFEVCLH